MMISIWNVAQIRSYKEAHDHFESTRYPARSKKWFEHQRPLRNTSSPHLRIERNEVHGVKCYDLCLYTTELVRYFEPNAQGEEAVWLFNHYSNSSQRFLWNAGWYNRMECTKQDGEKFLLQLSNQGEIARHFWGDHFTCRLVFDMHGKVIAEKSVHVPFTRKSSTDTRRAKRKQLREDFTPVFDMLEMQYQSFIDGVEINERAGQPFRSRDYDKVVSSDTRTRLKTEGFKGLTPDDLTAVVQYATNCCYNIAESIVNRRAYQYRTDRSLSYEAYRRMESKREVPVDGELLSRHVPEVVERLTPTWEDIKKAVELDLLYLAGVAEGDEYVPYPQLAKTFAKRCYGLVKPAFGDIPNMLGIETYDKLVNRKGVVY
jgi:hypothetical protein